MGWWATWPTHPSYVCALLMGTQCQLWYGQFWNLKTWTQSGGCIQLLVMLCGRSVGAPSVTLLVLCYFTHVRRWLPFSTIPLKEHQLGGLIFSRISGEMRDFCPTVTMASRVRRRGPDVTLSCLCRQLVITCPLFYTPGGMLDHPCMLKVLGGAVSVTGYGCPALLGW